MTNWLRKNAGSIISSIGLVLLAILTFGDIGELMTAEYWANVGGNISSIGALTIGLVMVQTSIKQGVSEQALSTGLNTQPTKDKYKEHKDIVAKCNERQPYLPYFLSMRNERETKRRKREFLIDNNFTSEKMLMNSNNKKLIKKYNLIQTNITPDSIKWSTTAIVYRRNGQIEKLEVYRKRRAIKGFVTALIWMLGTTLIAGGLFLDKANIPFWQKMVKFITYIIIMGIGVLFDIGKNYEKGAFGIPNELEEINGIWKEFDTWETPQWVIKEVEENFNQENIKLLGFSENKEIVQPDVATGTNVGTIEDKVEPEKEEPIENEIKEETDNVEGTDNQSEEGKENLNTGTDIQENTEKIEVV